MAVMGHESGGEQARGPGSVRLEDLTPGAVVRGLVPGEAVTIVAARWAGSRSLVLTYRRAAGSVDEQVLYRDAEAHLSLVEGGRAFSFEAPGDLFRDRIVREMECCGVELTEEGLERFFVTVLPHLDERQRRVTVGAMAEVLGRGGQARVVANSKRGARRVGTPTTTSPTIDRSSGKRPR